MHVKNLDNPATPRTEREMNENERYIAGGPGSGAAASWQMPRAVRNSIGRISARPDMTLVFRESGAGTSLPNIDISEDARHWCIEADLPGVRAEDVYVRAQDGHLVFSGAERPAAAEPSPEAPEGERRYHLRERHTANFERAIPLPDNIDADAIRCHFSDGVLRCYLPKVAREPAPPRQVPVMPATAAESPGPARAGANAAPPPVVPAGQISGGLGSAGTARDAAASIRKTGTLSRSRESGDSASGMISPGEPLS